MSSYHAYVREKKRCMSVKQEQEGILYNDFYILVIDYCSNVILEGTANKTSKRNHQFQMIEVR